MSNKGEFWISQLQDNLMLGYNLVRVCKDTMSIYLICNKARTTRKSVFGSIWSALLSFQTWPLVKCQIRFLNFEIFWSKSFFFCLSCNFWASVCAGLTRNTKSRFDHFFEKRFFKKKKKLKYSQENAEDYL